MSIKEASQTNTTLFKFLSEDNGINIFEKYDVFLMDIWGVIHDGFSLYPGVLETLEIFNQKNKKVIFFSNAPRRKNTIKATLDKFSIEHTLYDRIINSGEFIYYVLQQKKQYGKKYFHIGNPVGEEVIARIDGYQKVQHPQEANFSILTSTLSFHDEALELAKESIKYNLPLLCTNPDKRSIKIDGNEVICPGVIAELYESWGGKVVYFGKPYVEIYQYASEFFDDKSKVLAIGDSLENDIQGANHFGIDSLFITSGIHRNDLNTVVGKYPSKEKITSILHNYSVRPTYVSSLLKDTII